MELLFINIHDAWSSKKKCQKVCFSFNHLNSPNCVKLRTGVGLLLKHLSWRSHVWMMGVLPKVYFYRSIMRLSSGRLKTNINSARPLASDNCSCKIPIPAAIILNICLRLALHFLGCPMPRRLRIYSNETLHAWYDMVISSSFWLIQLVCLTHCTAVLHR